MRKSKPSGASAKSPARSDKAARLAEALRANLARRKAQQRARAGADAPAKPQD